MKRSHEKTAPHGDKSPPRDRQLLLFEYVVEDPSLRERLDAIQAGGDDWRTRWVAACVESAGFQRVVDQRSYELRLAGWELVSVQDVEDTDEGVRARLVMEQPA